MPVVPTGDKPPHQSTPDNVDRGQQRVGDSLKVVKVVAVLAVLVALVYVFSVSQ